MSKIDQIEEVLNTLKDIDGLKKERVDLIAQNDSLRDANAKLEQAERAAEAANRHARAVTEKAATEAAAARNEAETKAAAMIENARIEADEILENARGSATQIINNTLAQTASEREAISASKLERGVIESEIKDLEAKREQLVAAIDALKAVAKAL